MLSPITELMTSSFLSIEGMASVSLSCQFRRGEGKGAKAEKGDKRVNNATSRDIELTICLIYFCITCFLIRLFRFRCPMVESINFIFLL